MSTTNVYVGGYAWVDVSGWDLERIGRAKQSLTVTPRRTSRYASDEDLAPLHLYKERENLLGVPREYFMRHRRMEHQVSFDRVTPGRDWTIPHKSVFTPRDDQPDAIKAVMQRFRPPFGGAIVQAPTGWGKCLKIGTKVLRFDGSMVPVEALKVGDTLMGPDSRPRRVLSVREDFGPMYKIQPVKGDPWFCNDAHILTLVHTETGEVVDIEIGDYLKKSAYWRHCHKQFTPENGVDFAPCETPSIDPYFMGVWFGDGRKSLDVVGVTTMDQEIVEMMEALGHRYELHLRRDDSAGTRCPTYCLHARRGQWNELLKRMQYVVGDASQIPRCYLVGSRETRQAFLAGFIDSDGHHNDGCYQITQKRRAYADAVAFVARSLGIFATISSKEINGQVYWRVQLTGDFSELPMRIPRKKPRERQQKKVATRVGFTVEEAESSRYVGFELDGDGRFLLGDFTVTHNTVFAISVACELKGLTVILVDKEKLKNQWEERILEQVPTARVGVLQEDRLDIDADFIIAMKKSMTSRFHEALYREARLIIADEVHHIGARTYAPILPRFTGPYRLGLSAKPKRNDGCDTVFFWNIGPVVYRASVRRLVARIVFRKTRWKPVWTPHFNPEKMSDQKLLSIMIKDVDRNTMIVDDIVKAVKSGRRIIVFSHRKKHLETLRQMFARVRPSRDITDGFLIGGLSRKEQERSDKCHVIWATLEYLKEAYDNKDIDTIALTTPISDPEQPVGRATRWKPDKKEPLVLDYVDSGPSIFSDKRYESRRRVYKQIKAIIHGEDGR